MSSLPQFHPSFPETRAAAVRPSRASEATLPPSLLRSTAVPPLPSVELPPAPRRPDARPAPTARERLIVEHHG
ncbi:MAG: hypothetical protein ACK4YP_27145, partial [Myxococcota bacterium]